MCSRRPHRLSNAAYCETRRVNSECKTGLPERDASHVRFIVHIVDEIIRAMNSELLYLIWAVVVGSLMATIRDKAGLNAYDCDVEVVVHNHGVFHDALAANIISYAGIHSLPILFPRVVSGPPGRTVCWAQSECGRLGDTHRTARLAVPRSGRSVNVTYRCRRSGRQLNVAVMDITPPHEVALINT